jgi:hypothetical protein
MSQYVPDVTEEDVERIVRRDYPPDVQAAVREMIRKVEVREKPRVILSCLKVAQGDLKRLEGELHDASGWYREIISEAEYPGYTKVWFRIDRLPAEEVDRIIEKDKKQYLEWLHRDRRST